MHRKGFSLAEILIILLITSVVIAVTMPALTVKKKESGIDSQIAKCVNNDLTASTDISSSACSGVASDCCAGVDMAKNNANPAFSTLLYFAENGSKTDLARKILQEACNRGGTEACKYLVNTL